MSAVYTSHDVILIEELSFISVANCVIKNFGIDRNVSETFC